MIRRLLLMVWLAFALAAPARADDISAAARGVVRVVITASINGDEIGRGHGSGFAVAPNTIVTNAHVVELAQRFPSLVSIDVVPETGEEHYRGELIAFDVDRDLALIRFDGPPLPPLTLYGKPLPDGYPLVSLGYPGNIDEATYNSLAQLLMPTEPARSTGILSSHRSQRGLDTLEHTAQIARGNSGGPLLDNCGRVVGVNRAVTTAQEGDGSFVISLAENELITFLREKKQAFHAVDWPCTSMADALERDREMAAEKARLSEQQARDRQIEAQRAYDEALRQARADNAATRDNFMAGAAVALVFGALGAGGAGLLAMRGRKRPAIAAGAGGGILLIGAGLLFVLRPDFDPASVEQPAPGNGERAVQPSTGRFQCIVAPERSRITVSDGAPVPLTWGEDGCAGGKTQYVEKGDTWQRVIVPEAGQTVRLATYDPLEHSYVEDRYFLDAATMKQLREMQGDAKAQCTSDPAVRGELASRQSSLRSLLPPQPNERLVYSCRAADTKQ
ncbi:S1 family peptidase [Stakelama saccharophila]|uniref:Serine protease n=1 Tax=Stakelama saccharophila TaxID=3075605 RepID=A0ABZ0BAK8_9SPHN|nr:serine protease [Stakelama sp. W311]WNO53349.1 serine protease [Stakelama sp. W311]